MEPADVRVAISFSGFGTFIVQSLLVPLHPEETPRAREPMYTFPSETTRIEPSSLGDCAVQVL